VVLTAVPTRESRRLQRASVVICTYSEARLDDVSRAITSVQVQTLRPLETIVVVDHNEPLRQRLLALAGEANVTASRHAPGLSGARNTGLELARGDVVAFLDDDAVADAEWLERLLSGYGEDTVGVGGAVIPRWQGERPAWFPEEFDWVVGCSYRGLPEGPGEVRNPIGANMSFRREPLRLAGGFSSMLGRIDTKPVGCEETEACIRISRLRPNGHFRYEPAALVVHKVHRDRERLSYFVSRCYGEGVSKAVLTRRHGSTAALASERAYLRQILPRAFAQGLRAILGGDVGGARRCAAVLLGVAAAGAGYAHGRLRRLSHTGAGRSA
jgi:glycosyltransferase involved in cell wall biosynthesis